MTPFDAIPPGEIHLWFVSMDDARPHLTALRSCLSTEELDRAARYRMPDRGDRFIVARGSLRWILGKAIGLQPESVSFTFGPNGKPYLPDGAPFFNASDSGEFVVVAMASTEIGIDLEVLRPMARRDRLAKRICTDQELEAFTALPDAEKNRALLRLWTCKEAGLKATGIGLTGGMQNIEVEILTGGTLRLRRLLDHRDGWKLIPIGVHEAVVCTAITRDAAWTVVPHPAESLFS